MIKHSLLGILLMVMSFSLYADINESITKTQQGVIYIVSSGVDEKGKEIGGTGTGFLIDNDKKLVVTNFHVIETSLGQGKIFIADGGLKNDDFKSATVIASSPQLDLALLQVPALKERPALSIVDSKATDNSIIEGQDVWSIGFPSISQEWSLTTAYKLDQNNQLKKEDFASMEKDILTPTLDKGIIKKVTQTRTWGEQTNGLTSQTSAINILHHSADVNHGNSGGPLVNDCGMVVGVNTLVDNRDVNTINKALSAIDLVAFLDKNGANYHKTSGICTPIAATKPAPVSTTTSVSKTDSAGLNGWYIGGLALLTLTLLSGWWILNNRRLPVNLQAEAVSLPLTATPKLANGTTSQYYLQGLDHYHDLYFPLHDNAIQLGRMHNGNDYSIDDDSVSRQHLNLRKEANGWVAIGRDTVNGTSINGVELKAHEVRNLLPNDILQLGRVRLVLHKT